MAWLLTWRPSNSLSAAVCLPVARHQNAPVARLQPVLITKTAGRHTAACLYINQNVWGFKHVLNVNYLVAGVIVRTGRAH
jgi:hypothetical protein